MSWYLSWKDVWWRPVSAQAVYRRHKASNYSVPEPLGTKCRSHVSCTSWTPNCCRNTQAPGLSGYVWMHGGFSGVGAGFVAFPLRLVHTFYIFLHTFAPWFLAQRIKFRVPSELWFSCTSRTTLKISKSHKIAVLHDLQAHVRNTRATWRSLASATISKRCWPASIPTGVRLSGSALVALVRIL